MKGIEAIQMGWGLLRWSEVRGSGADISGRIYCVRYDREIVRERGDAIYLSWEGVVGEGLLVESLGNLHSHSVPSRGKREKP